MMAGILLSQRYVLDPWMHRSAKVPAVFLRKGVAVSNGIGLYPPKALWLEGAPGTHYLIIRTRRDR